MRLTARPQDTASNTDFNNRLLNTLKGAVSVDYTSYMDVSSPPPLPPPRGWIGS